MRHAALLLVAVACWAGCYDFGRLSRLTDLAGTDKGVPGDAAQSLCQAGLPPGGLLAQQPSYSDPGGANGNFWVAAIFACDGGACPTALLSPTSDSCVGTPPGVHICPSGLADLPAKVGNFVPTVLTGGLYVFEAWVQIDDPADDTVSFWGSPFVNSVSGSGWQVLAATTQLAAADSAYVAIQLSSATDGGAPHGCFDLDATWFGLKADL